MNDITNVYLNNSHQRISSLEPQTECPRWKGVAMLGILLGAQINPMLSIAFSAKPVQIPPKPLQLTAGSLQEFRSRAFIDEALSNNSLVCDAPVNRLPLSTDEMIHESQELASDAASDVAETQVVSEEPVRSAPAMVETIASALVTTVQNPKEESSVDNIQALDVIKEPDVSQAFVRFIDNLDQRSTERHQDLMRAISAMDQRSSQVHQNLIQAIDNLNDRSTKSHLATVKATTELAGLVLEAQPSYLESALKKVQSVVGSIPIRLAIVAGLCIYAKINPAHWLNRDYRDVLRLR